MVHYIKICGRFDGNRYYSKEDGALAIGEQIIDGITYMFDESGKLVNN